MTTNPLHVTASGCRVFFDFDNTITTRDVLDDIIRQFAVSDDWRALEDAWRSGTISSQACLTGQLRLVRVTRRQLARYLDEQVTLDHAFRTLLAFFRRRGVHPVILSDSFEWMIRRVLRRHGIRGVRVYANRLRVAEDRLIPSFPHLNGCSRCANCKRQHLRQRNTRRQTTIFIGDGLSDLCAAEVADVVFAKGALRDALRATRRPHIPIQGLTDVHQRLRRSLR